MRFKRSKIYLSVIPVVVVGLFIGFVGAIIGIGGGFILIPLMIYVLRVPTRTVIGTSMVLTLVTMVFATMLHAVTNHLVDAVLALILMVGGVTGAQFGARAGQRIRGEHLRLLLGLLILAVGIRFAIELTIRPDELFTVRETGGRRMIARASFAASVLAWLLSAALDRAGARRTADRVGLQSPRDRDAELFRRGAGAVRLDRKGRRYAAEPHRLRSRRHRLRAARRHGDTPQGEEARHLDQHRLAPVPQGPDLSRAVLQPSVRRHRLAARSSGASSSGSTTCC